MHIRSLVLASLAVVALTSGSFAACKNFVTVTPDNAPVNRVGTVVGGAGSTRQGNMSSTLAVCDEGSTHPWHDKMVANGSCTPNGYEWASLAGPVTASELRKYVTFDGNVPDIEQHRNGIQLPPILGGGFLPTTPLLPGAC